MLDLVTGRKGSITESQRENVHGRGLPRVHAAGPGLALGRTDSGPRTPTMPALAADRRLLRSLKQARHPLIPQAVEHMTPLLAPHNQPTIVEHPKMG